jgi:hypothetical protein
MAGDTTRRDVFTDGTSVGHPGTVKKQETHLIAFDQTQ